MDACQTLNSFRSLPACSGAQSQTGNHETGRDKILDRKFEDGDVVRGGAADALTGDEIVQVTQHGLAIDDVTLDGNDDVSRFTKAGIALVDEDSFAPHYLVIGLSGGRRKGATRSTWAPG